VTPQELEQRFGKEVASLVMEVTDDKSLPKEERKAIQVKDAHTKTPRAQTLKLADKISNLRALLSTPPANWSVQRKRDYFDWARDVVSRLTHPNPTLKAEFDRTYARIHEIES
jgi:guanosine-3',5'-bis(diphosphate) 3'-pyrophosphohydrolase